MFIYIYIYMMRVSGHLHGDRLDGVLSVGRFAREHHRVSLEKDKQAHELRILLLY